MTRLFWLCLVAACAAGTTSGCKPKKQAAAPSTSVAEGELFETGQPVYDEYFGTVHELHAAVATGELEERDARTTLATMLQLLPTAPTAQIIRKLRERADELPRMQLKIEKEKDRQTAEVVLLDSGRPEDATKNLVMVLEATVNATLDLARRMSEIPERSRRMHTLCKTLLDGTETELSGQTPERRQHVRLELEASLDVLVLVANASRDVEARARQFVADIQEALRETEDNEPVAAKPRRGGASRPAPKPAPKMPDDFNP